MKHNRYQLNDHSRNNKKMLLIAGVIVIVIALLLAGGYFYKQHQDEQRRLEQKAKDEAQTSSAKKDASTKNTSDDSNIPSTSIKQDVPQADATVTIQSVNQANGAVTATATSSSASGTCVFTYTTDGDKPVTRNVGIEGGTCTSTIPEVEFARLGTWNLNVTVYIDGKKTEANQSVTID